MREFEKKTHPSYGLIQFSLYCLVNYNGNYNYPNKIAVNGGDWIGEELIEIIDNWCQENGFEVEYEAEVDDEYFYKKGYSKFYI